MRNVKTYVDLVLETFIPYISISVQKVQFTLCFVINRYLTIYSLDTKLKGLDIY